MQLGVALQHYQNVYEVLPPGVVNHAGPIQNVPMGYHHGWLVQLLPYLDQKNIARNVNDARGLYATENQTVRRVTIAVLLCPSDPGPSRGPGGIALGNYAAFHNDTEAPINTRNKGVFFLNSRIGYEDIPDGASNTLFVGEKKRHPLELGWASGTRASLRNAGSRPDSPDLLYGAEANEMWEEGEASSRGIAIMPDPNNPYLVGGFSSAHRNGANYAFGDGSVRFLSNAMGASVLQRLANRADGEPIEEY
jgi:prepilin-type processing-associated H-X9-DG protein